VFEVASSTHFHSKNVPAIIEEKPHLVLSSPEDHCHYETDAESGLPETQAKDKWPVFYDN